MRISGTRLAAVSLTATLALATPAAAVASPLRGPDVAGELKASAAEVLPRADLVLRGSLPPRKSRPVHLQVRRGGEWAELDRGRSGQRGTFRFALEAPAKAGSRDYRVLAPATTLSGKRLPALVTPTRTVTVVEVVAVDAGWQHDCAVGSHGKAWCWGDNNLGALGDGSVPDIGPGADVSDGPVRVVGRNWASISAEGASTCGLKDDGSGWCWGELVTFWAGGAHWDRAGTPQPVADDWTQIAAGTDYFCGVDSEHRGWCQGRYDGGQLGPTDPPDTDTPVQLPGEWRQLVTGGHFYGDAVTCGIRLDRSAWCWGAGSGELEQVPGGHSWSSLSVGHTHSCGTTTDGNAWCWGSNGAGQLGDGTFTESASPVEVDIAGSGTWQTVDAGYDHTCGVQSDGDGWCWGWNDRGQLGDGTFLTTYWPEPVPNQLPGSWSDLAAGWFVSVGAGQDGAARAWGEGAYGQLGSGTADDVAEPVEVAVP